MASLTFPELFAIADSVAIEGGAERCFWCGASCGRSSRVTVSGTFWDWDAVAFPSSRYQCSGCNLCLDEKREMAGRERPQKVRNHSWLATDEPRLESLTKADLVTMREVCLTPPTDCCWGLAIAASGQKHILFRTPVNLPGQEHAAVQLELTRVVYSPQDLRAAIHVCAEISFAVGKPRLDGPLDGGCASAIAAIGRDPDELISTYNAAWNSPLWRLAAFLTPSKKDSHDYLAETHA